MENIALFLERKNLIIPDNIEGSKIHRLIIAKDYKCLVKAITKSFDYVEFNIINSALYSFKNMDEISYYSSFFSSGAIENQWLLYLARGESPEEVISEYLSNEYDIQSFYGSDFVKGLICPNKTPEKMMEEIIEAILKFEDSNLEEIKLQMRIDYMQSFKEDMEAGCLEDVADYNARMKVINNNLHILTFNKDDFAFDMKQKGDAYYMSRTLLSIKPWKKSNSFFKVIQS